MYFSRVAAKSDLEKLVKQRDDDSKEKHLLVNQVKTVQSQLSDSEKALSEVEKKNRLLVEAVDKAKEDKDKLQSQGANHCHETPVV